MTTRRGFFGSAAAVALFGAGAVKSAPVKPVDPRQLPVGRSVVLGAPGGDENVPITVHSRGSGQIVFRQANGTEEMLAAFD